MEMQGERPPVDWRKRHLVLNALTERVQRLSRPDEEWLDAPAADTKAPTRTPRASGERASVEEALRILSESRVKMQGVRYTVYEPKTLRLRGEPDAAGELQVGASAPAKASTTPVLEQEPGVEPPFAQLKEARSPRKLLPTSPLAALDGSVPEVEEQWRKVQQQHLERKQAAAIKYNAPPSPSPLPVSYSLSSSPRTLLRSSPLSTSTAAAGGSRAYATSSGISAVTSQVSLTGVGAHYHYAPQHAAEVAQRKRLHSSSASRGGALGDLAYTPARDLMGFAPSPRHSSTRHSNAASEGLTIKRSASSPLHRGYALPTSSRIHDSSDGWGLGDSADAISIPESTPPVSTTEQYTQQPQPQPQPEPEPEPRLQEATSLSPLPSFSSFSPMPVHSSNVDPIVYRRSPRVRSQAQEQDESVGEETRRRRAQGDHSFFGDVHDQISQIGL